MDEVSQARLKHVFQSSQPRVAHGKALDGIDCDHDGEINYAEFVKMLR